MKNSGTKKFVSVPEFFLPRLVVVRRRGRFVAIFVLRVVVFRVAIVF